MRRVFECTGLFERVVERLVGEQRYIMDKLDGMGRRRARFRAIVDADEGFGDKAWDYLRQRCATEYARFYREDGTLRDEYHSSCEAAEKFNRDVGFYEPSLMEDIWIEHYAHRRQPIVDEDGLWRRDRSHAGAGPVFGRRPGASKRRRRPVPMRLPRQAAFPPSDASSTASRRSLSSTRRRQKTRRTPRPRPRRAISTATAFSSSPCRPTR